MVHAALVVDVEVVVVVAVVIVGNEEDEELIPVFPEARELVPDEVDDEGAKKNRNYIFIYNTIALSERSIHKSIFIRMSFLSFQSFFEL